jgi:hypothetical protein
MEAVFWMESRVLAVPKLSFLMLFFEFLIIYLPLKNYNGVFILSIELLSESGETFITIC